jgi:hypothetical protein
MVANTHHGADAGFSESNLNEWPGVAHAISPDVRYGHPALRSLHGSFASASCLRSLPRPSRLASATARKLAGVATDILPAESGWQVATGILPVESGWQVATGILPVESGGVRG